MTTAVSTQEQKTTCKDLVRAEYRSRLSDLRERWHAETHPSERCRVCGGSGKHTPEGFSKEYLCEYCTEGTYPEDGTLNEFGLSFDYVPRGTFRDQRRGYWRYQLSWGGPSDEFRFYCDETRTPARIEYWHMDWFDGAKVSVKPGSADWTLLLNIWEWFDGADCVRRVFDEAQT